MPFPTITQYYEERNFKKVLVVIAVASHLLSPNPRDISWDFSEGTVPTCSFTMDNPAPAYVVKDAAIQLFVGYHSQSVMQFNGTIESVSPSESGLVVQCSGQSKKMDAPYKAVITNTDGTDVSLMLASIFQAANVFSYVIDLPAWTPGTVVQQPLHFSTWAEAVNKLAEPFGSPYYEMPSGVIRVDVRDPIPAPNAFRTYFSGVLTNGAYAQPAAVAAVNVNAQPRINQVSKEMLSRDVRNRIIVRGADVPGVGGDGEVINTLLEETAEGPSPWIPPVNGVEQFVELVFQCELLDTVSDMARCALRLFNLWNRLFEKVSLTVEGDPEIFLGATVSVIDLGYSGVNAKYVVKGYSSHISSAGFTTTLDLQGGRSAGVSPNLSPFAFFTWTNANVPISPANDVNAGNNTNLAPNAAKVRQFVPDASGAPATGEGQDTGNPGDDGQRVIVTFDGSASVDPDGRIVSWAWADDAGHSGTGKRFTVTFNPDDVTDVAMTLTVTDNDGLTAAVTQSVNVNTFGPSDGYGNEQNTGTTEDTAVGGGDLNVPVIFVALETDGIAATIPGDGGSTFNTYPAFDYVPRCVAAAKYKETEDLIAIYAGRVAFITTSYLQVNPTIVPFGGDYGVCYDIVGGSGGAFSAVSNDGTNSWVLRTSDYGETWEVQATLANEKLMRLSGNYCLGTKGIWVLEDGSLTPFDPNQVGIAPTFTEPAWLLVNDDSLLFNNRYIANVHDIHLDPSGFTTGTGIEEIQDFVKVLLGSESYIGLTSAGNIYEGDGVTWEEISIGTNGLTNAWDFVAEEGMDGVFLAANAEGISKTVNKGIKWARLALRASGVLTVAVEPTPGDTITIGGKAYEFVVTATMDGEIQIGNNSAISNAINGTDGNNTPHTLVTADDASGNTVTIRAIVPGAAGDSIGTTETFADPANFFDAATLGAKNARIGLRLPSQPSVNDTMTIEAKVFTFKAVAAVNGDIAIGVDLDTTQANVVAAINGTDGINTPHAVVTAQDFLSNTCIISTIAVVAPGYVIAASETFTPADDEFVAGSAIASSLGQALRLEAINVAQTRPTADLYGVTATA